MMKINLNNLTDHTKLIISATLEQLPLLAKSVHDFLQAGDWLFLEGDLGAGKTALVKQISLLFGVENFFTSPTFSILNSEKLRVSQNGILNLLHLDLYRLKAGKELCFVGFEQEFNVQNSLALFEWPDVLEKEDWTLFFQLTGCARPKRILHIKIDGYEKNRQYEIAFFHF